MIRESPKQSASNRFRSCTARALVGDPVARERLQKGACYPAIMRLRAYINPDSPDEMAFGQLRAPNLAVTSNSYAESSSRILTDPTGERRNRQFCQRFRGLRSCWPNPSGESGLQCQLRERRADVWPLDPEPPKGDTETADDQRRAC